MALYQKTGFPQPRAPAHLLFTFSILIMLTKTFAKFLATIAVLGTTTTAAPFLAPRTDSQHDLRHKTIAQLNNTGTWFENVISQQNGDLLITMMAPNASIYRLRNPASPHPELSLVHTIPDADGLLGIAETGPDTVVVAGSRFEAPASPTPGTMAVWEVKVGPEPSTARKIVDIPEAGMLNGVAWVPGRQQATAVLIADSAQGVIYRVDVATGAYEIVVDAPETKLVSGSAFEAGANGAKVRGGYLYWSNSNLVAFYRVEIDARGYPAPGAGIEQVATAANAATIVDDFAFDQRGDIWSTTNLDYTLVKVAPGGSAFVVLGGPGQLVMAGNAAAAFGQTPADKHILYVVTDGALASPVNGTIIEPAKVVAVDTRYS